MASPAHYLLARNRVSFRLAQHCTPQWVTSLLRSVSTEVLQFLPPCAALTCYGCAIQLLGFHRYLYLLSRSRRRLGVDSPTFPGGEYYSDEVARAEVPRVPLRPHQANFGVHQAK